MTLPKNVPLSEIRFPGLEAKPISATDQAPISEQLGEQAAFYDITQALVAAALEKTEPNEENLQDLIEIALHEGVAPALGYRLVLKNYGTCNAITMFDSAVSSRPRADQQDAAGMLLVHLHHELMANVRADMGVEP